MGGPPPDCAHEQCWLQCKSPLIAACCTYSQSHFTEQAPGVHCRNCSLADPVWIGEVPPQCCVGTSICQIHGVLHQMAEAVMWGVGEGPPTSSWTNILQTCSHHRGETHWVSKPCCPCDVFVTSHVLVRWWPTPCVCGHISPTWPHGCCSFWLTMPGLAARDPPTKVDRSSCWHGYLCIPAGKSIAFMPARLTVHSSYQAM